MIKETITLKELYQMLKKRFLLIVIVTVVAALAGGVVSYFVMTPMYQASTQLLVNSASEGNPIDNSEIQGNIQLINTYNVILTSSAILDQVITKLDLDTTASQLRNHITVGNATNSQVITISVTDEDANQACLIANTTAEIFQKEIGNMMKVDNVSILTKATYMEAMNPVSPVPSLNIAIACVIGLIIGVAAAIILEYVDNTVKTEQDIEALFDFPIIGVVPVIKETDRKKAGTKQPPKEQARISV